MDGNDNERTERETRTPTLSTCLPFSLIYVHIIVIVISFSFASNGKYIILSVLFFVCVCFYSFDCLVGTAVFYAKWITLRVFVIVWSFRVSSQAPASLPLLMEETNSAVDSVACAKERDSCVAFFFSFACVFCFVLLCINGRNWGVLFLCGVCVFMFVCFTKLFIVCAVNRVSLPHFIFRNGFTSYLILKRAEEGEKKKVLPLLECVLGQSSKAWFASTSSHCRLFCLLVLKRLSSFEGAALLFDNVKMCLFFFFRESSLNRGIVLL